MSIEIPVAFVTQFSANVHMLAEQRTSRLRQTVLIEQVTGESFTAERVGKVEVNAVEERHGDTPLNSTPHTRRWGFIKDYDVADLIDKPDRIKLLINPDSVYTIKHSAAMGRSFDTEIIRVLGANSINGHTGGTTTAFPTATQEIAHGSTGMTVQKLLQAKEILDKNEVDDYIPRFVVCGSRQVRELLEDDKLTSADYNTVRALAEGRINDYLGFRFIRTELLSVTSNIRSCYAYTGMAIRMGVAQEPTSIANQRPDKRNAVQIYTYGSWGGIRVEDEQVVRILSDET